MSTVAETLREWAEAPTFEGLLPEYVPVHRDKLMSLAEQTEEEGRGVESDPTRQSPMEDAGLGE